MEEAIRGAVLGGVIGVILIALEYMMLSKAAKERAVREHKKESEAKLDEVARLRIKTITRFALVLPIMFGAGFWLIWG